MFGIFIATSPTLMRTNYAGFWLRLVALIIDFIIIGILQGLIFIPLLTALGFGFFDTISGMDMEDSSNIVGAVAALVAAAGASWILATAIHIVYFTMMEASKYQATLGKMALGIKVTDLDGSPLNFTRALLRNLCKLISNFTMLIGYVMAGFTEKKQALHDMIAGTLVTTK